MSRHAKQIELVRWHRGRRRDYESRVFLVLCVGFGGNSRYRILSVRATGNQSGTAVNNKPSLVDANQPEAVFFMYAFCSTNLEAVKKSKIDFLQLLVGK